MKIRGIKLDTLVESDLIPALPSLIKMWDVKKGNHTSVVQWTLIYSLCMKILLLALAVTGLLLSQIPEQRFDILVFGGLFMLIVSVTMISLRVKIWRFTKSMSKLDDLLKKYCPDSAGLPDLPWEQKTIGKTLETVLVQIAVAVLEAVRTDPECAFASMTKTDSLTMRVIMNDLNYSPEPSTEIYSRARKIMEEKARASLAIMDEITTAAKA